MALTDATIKAGWMSTLKHSAMALTDAPIKAGWISTLKHRKSTCDAVIFTNTFAWR